MATDAERQRRSRAHRRGDHSLCDPTRCDPTAVTPPVTGHVTTRPRLDRRGRRLWGELAGKDKPGPAELVLIEEACRIADRLDRLDALVRGDADAWLRFSVSDDGTEVTVVIDKALSEARQQAVALKQLLAELRQSRGSSGAAASGSEVDPVDDLAARRKARIADAAGS